MLRALTFDFWGTLYNNAFALEERLSLVDDVLARHGESRSREHLTEAYSHARSVWDRVWRVEQRSIPIERWLDEFLGHLDVDLPEKVASELGQELEEIHLRGAQPRPVADVTDVLPELARRYRLGLISDTGLTPGRVLRQVMRRDGLLSFFDVLTFSDELGAAKPRPEPFRRTLDLLGTRPEGAAHIGDLPETDVQGARRAGMKAILFLGVSEREDGRHLADAVFKRYSELEGVLERLG